MFSYLSPEERVPQEHPLPAIQQMIDVVLKELAPQVDALYAHTGRPSMPSEPLRRALWLQVLYTARSEQLLMRQVAYNLLFPVVRGLEQG
jgi:transposase